MKAKTASQKRKAKRGRPKLPATDREKSGRPSRREASKTQRNEMSQAAIMAPAIERRIRQDNIVPFKENGGKLVTAEEQAKDPRRGYTLGLMLLDHSITQRQHDAGVKFAEVVSRFHGLTGVPLPNPRAQNLFAVRGNEGDESESKVDAAKNARRRYNEARDVLLSVGHIDEGRHVIHAVTEVAYLENMHARRWPEHMTFMLRKGLNKLADFYMLPT